jgi:uncharacterized protein (DUF1697 family)
MTRFIALLRAVNVGGTGKLPMAELRAMCGEAGFSRIETYIASGNAVFDADVLEADVKAALEARLGAYAGKSVGVVVRAASEMRAVLEENPFPDAESKFTNVFFLDAAPPTDALAHISGRLDEEARLGAREIYVHYPTGMGRSKLKIPAAKTATARNMNTVAALVEIASRP